MTVGGSEVDRAECALAHLEQAERGRAQARALRAEAEALDARADSEELEAERDLEKMRGHGHGHDEDEVKVRFRHLGEHETATFRVDDDVTLRAMWGEAYGELEIERGERDVLQAPQPGGNPVSLMEHLDLSLEEARRQGLCERLFEIAARTGGA